MTPIQTLIEFNGEAVTIETPPDNASGSYQPGSSVDYVPPKPETADVMGAQAKREFLLDTAVAGVYIDATARPAHLEEGRSHVVWRGRRYAVMKVQERFYLGALDGYLLQLSA